MLLETDTPMDVHSPDNERRYQNLFDYAPVALWDVDLSRVARWFALLRQSGVNDLRNHLLEQEQNLHHQYEEHDTLPLLVIRSCNREALKLFGVGSMEEMSIRFAERFSIATSTRWIKPLVHLWNVDGPIAFETHFQRTDGRIVHLLVRMQVPRQNSSTTQSGHSDWSHVIVTVTDISDVRFLKEEHTPVPNKVLPEKARRDALQAGLGLAMNRNTSIGDMLRICCDAIQMHAHAAFVGVWTLNEADRSLELQVRVGNSAYANNTCQKVPLGHCTIGRIAETGQSVLTNSVIGNPQFGDQEWAEREGIESFAGFPLICENKILGVLALYSHTSLTESSLDDIRLTVETLAEGLVRKRAEAAQREKNGLLHSLATSSMDCKITIDGEGNILEFNPEAEQTLGYERHEVIGKALGGLIIPNEQDSAFITDVIRYLKTRPSLILGRRLMDLPARRKDGSTFPTELTIVSTEHSGNLVFAAFLKDITQQREAEQKRKVAVAEMVRAKEEAEASNRAKTQFLANMSHEFRTPMAAVVGYAQILLDPRNTVDQRMATVHAIRRNGKHLLALINDVLDLTKIEAGRLEVERVGFRLWRTIAEALSVAGVQAQEKKLTLNAVTEGRVPRVITSDPTRVRQILDNLLSNAVKFTLPEKEVEVRVRLKYREPENDAVMQIDVRDEGIGMSPEVISRLFKPFSQADASTTRKFGGTGLGLSICKKLAESLRGSLDVQSTVGVGSKFTLSIPVDPDDLNDLVDEDDLSKESLMIRPRTVTTERKLTGRILLAEDNPDNRYIICFFLEKAGLTVEVAENGRVAVEMACSMDYDVVLMDMQMPELDGYEATSSLRQKGYRKAIVALTAHAMADDEEKCMLAGCDAYMTKPVEYDHLIETISKFLPTRSWVMKTAQLHRTIPAPPPNSQNIASPANLTYHTNQTIISQPTTAVTPMPSAVPNTSTSPTTAQIQNKTSAKLDKQYRKSMPKKIEEMVATLRRGELIALASQAHRLKGSAGMYGFPKISETAGLIEQAVRESQNAALLEELISELKTMAIEIAKSAKE